MSALVVAAHHQGRLVVEIVVSSLVDLMDTLTNEAKVLS